MQAYTDERERGFADVSDGRMALACLAAANPIISA